MYSGRRTHICCELVLSVHDNYYSSKTRAHWDAGYTCEAAQSMTGTCITYVYKARSTLKCRGAHNRITQNSKGVLRTLRSSLSFILWSCLLLKITWETLFQSSRILCYYITYVGERGHFGREVIVEERVHGKGEFLWWICFNFWAEWCEIQELFQIKPITISQCA